MVMKFSVINSLVLWKNFQNVMKNIPQIYRKLIKLVSDLFKIGKKIVRCEIQWQG
jgi:hypothetical protein